MAYRDGAASVRLTGTRNARVKVARWDYDFATDGGAQGAITLRGGELPSGALVIDARVVVTANVTSGGAATVSIGLEAATDMRAAATLATAPALNATGVKALLNPVLTTAARDVVATVATADLTAGTFYVVVTYVEV